MRGGKKSDGDIGEGERDRGERDRDGGGERGKEGEQWCRSSSYHGGERRRKREERGERSKKFNSKEGEG